MTKSTSDNNASDPSTGANKRAFDRIALKLGAVVRTSAGSEIPCTIRDFSPGGMLLFFGRGDDREPTPPRHLPIKDSFVAITCRVKQGSVLTLEFRANVVRLSESGFAVRLEKPDLEHLQILHKVAKLQKRLLNAAPIKGPEEPDRHATISVPERAGVIEECKQSLLQSMGAMMQEFQDKVIYALEETSARTVDLSRMNELHSASRTIRSNGPTLTSKLIEQVVAKLDAYDPKAHASVYENADQLSVGAMALVDDDSYEDWLSDASTIDKAENRCREVLFELNVRLTEVFACEIDKDNNPFRPALFVDCFDTVIRSLGLDRKVNLFCFNVFRDVFLAQIQGIYGKINDLLIAKNIMPVISYDMRRKKSMPKSADIADDTAQLNMQPSDSPQTEKIPVAAPDAEDVPAVAATSTTEKPAQIDEEDIRSIFEIVGDLQELRENLTELRAAKAAATTETEKQDSQLTQESMAPVAPTYSVQDIVGSLSDIEYSGRTDDSDGKQSDFKEQILAVLAEKAGKDKQIGVREKQIIDVSDNLFRLLATDAHVSGEIRQWLSKLTIPIMKVALVDNTLFTDKDHPARQVINKITQLEVLVEESDKENHENTLARNAIEWIIGLVNEEFNGTAEVFNRAIQQLDILLNTQRKLYQKNLDGLVSDLKDHKLNLIDAAELPQHEQWDVDETTRAQWQHKVGRIKEMDWLVVEPNTDHPDRVRVGWVDRDSHQMALVNQIGKLERGVTFTDIARGLNEGSMAYLGAANEAAMDRAQYTMLEQLHSKLLDQACHDNLTGLYDRREFEKRLSLHIENTGVEKVRCAVAFIDLDKFKLINDSCGYEAGDALLKQVADEMLKYLPESAVLARMGSDEFAMLLQDMSLDDALDVMESQLEMLQQIKFEWDGKRFHLGASIGLVNVRKAGEKSSEVIHEAESSCGVAKDMGGNRIMVYHAGNRGLSFNQHVVKWAADLDRILEEDGLYLKCQRIMPIRGGGLRKNKYEILLGVRNMEGENISDYFIKAAERYNRMKDVDRWVIRNTFDWMKSNREKLRDIEAISINLSGGSMNDDSFLDFVKQELADGQVPAGKVCFELTETTGISSLSSASEFMLNLKETGCRFSLDDFGSGMSSYAYLKNLPVDYLKIDGSFILDMLSNPADEAVVRSICEVGHFMGMQVIAEYIENNVVLKKLQGLKVDYGQGYAIEKPKLLSKL